VREGAGGFLAVSHGQAALSVVGDGEIGRHGEVRLSSLCLQGQQ
jgi:hypothetical protein